MIVGAPFELEHRLRMFGFEHLAEIFNRYALSIDSVFAIGLPSAPSRPQITAFAPAVPSLAVGAWFALRTCFTLRTDVSFLTLIAFLAQPGHGSRNFLP